MKTKIQNNNYFSLLVFLSSSAQPIYRIIGSIFVYVLSESLLIEIDTHKKQSGSYFVRQ